MATLIGALALASTITTLPAMNPSSPPPLVAKTRSGQTIQAPAPVVQATRSYIVEFHEPPLVYRGGVAASVLTSKDSLLQRFRRDVASARLAKTAASDPVEHEYFRAFHGVSVTLDEQGADAVRHFAYVKKVHEDVPVERFDEDRTRIARIGADRVWSQFQARGTGIVVAVLDTGVDYTHPALATKYIGGFDFVTGDEDAMDEQGHGTHVAGIIAGEGDGVTGVAPNAKILSYRVLDEHGSGSSSDIMAAIEWTLDPDRDGDLSDHVDVANMSLGGSGDADSAMSLAVDNAVAGGVVFVLAAGNTPGGQTIGAPAASRRGITVGNSDFEDVLHFTSSRGPAYPNWDLKPEIVAPGTQIRSAKLGGGSLIASGTSMAAPHVAGAVALLLELHPDWTPEQVKEALVGSAHPIEEETMGQGGGRVDVYAAALSHGAIAPAVVTFGRNGNAGDWTASRLVRVTNRGTMARTFMASYVQPEGVTVTAEPAVFVLEAGASREVLLTTEIDGVAKPSLASLSHGGRVTFTTGDRAVHVPWVAVDAARAVVSHEVRSTIVWSCDVGTTYVTGRATTTHEMLLPHSRCDMVAYTLGPNGTSPSIFTSAFDVASDFDFAITTADTMHEVRLAGVDRQGRPLGDYAPGDTIQYLAMYDLTFGPESPFRALGFSTAKNNPLRVNALPAEMTLNTSEVLFDFPNRSLYAVHHLPLRGVQQSRTLSTLASDLRHARVNMAPRPDATLHGMAIYMQDGFGFGIGTLPVQSLANGWRGDVFVTPEQSPATWAGVALHTSDAPRQMWMEMQTPAFRSFGGRIVLSNDVIPSPAAYGVEEGGTLAIGETPLHGGSFVDRRETAFAVFPSFYGPAGEQSVGPHANLAYELRDDSGTLLREGTTDGYVTADFGTRGAYRATLRPTTGGELTVRFDSSLTDCNPPTLSSMRITGADARIVSSVRPGQSAALTFSVADMQVGEGGVPRHTRQVRTTRVSWRSGDGEWHELPIVATGEDAGDPDELKHWETGMHYRADLSPVTASAHGDIDLRVELEDASGNASTSVIEDALTIGAKRRAVRK